MLSDEPIDEDLEALLYAQVYYGKCEESDLTGAKQTELNTQNKEQTDAAAGESSPGRNYHQQKKRYFENSLLREDKEKEDTNIESPLKDSSTSETSFNNSTLDSSNLSENSLQNQTVLNSKDQSPDIVETHSQQYIEISTSTPNTDPSQKNSTQVVTNVPLLSSPRTANQPQLLNNITINQYLYPPNFLQRLKSSIDNNPLSKRCQRDLRKLKKGFLTEQEFFSNLKRRFRAQKKQQEQIRKVYLKRKRSIAQSEVICLTDSDDSDIEVVEVTENTNESEKTYHTMKTKAELALEANENANAEDDEIIYIEPPPVPVINIDTESDSEASDKDLQSSKPATANSQDVREEPATQKPSETQLDIDDTSNDFLQPKSTSDNFNFSLHGSDFQNPEFVRPANPTDLYETESSTSTSDFNRDSSREFSNTVKTIVFNEVEFPKEDIFNESNLESFGEFITPKRGDKEKPKDTNESVADTPGPKSSKRITTRTSSESSSESEYESSNTHQNLPDLTPMVCAASTPKTNKKGKRKFADTPKKVQEKSKEEAGVKTKSNKKKSKEKCFEDNDGIIDVGRNSESNKKTKRKSGESAEEDETPRKKSKKKKNKSGSKSAEENDPGSESSSTVSTVSDRNVICVALKKGLKDDWVVTSSSSLNKNEVEADSSSAQHETSKKKSKKKKKQSRNENDADASGIMELGDQTLDASVVEVEEQSEAIQKSAKKNGKKKKGKESSVNKIAEDERSTENQSGIEEIAQIVAEEQEMLRDNAKKRNKKRKYKDGSGNASESGVVTEVSTGTNNENDIDKNTEDKEGDNLNKSVEEQGTLDKDGSRLEDNHVLVDSASRNKNKRKKRTSSDKRSSIEEPNDSNDKNDSSKDVEQNKQKKDKLEKERRTVDVAEKEKEEEDIILIEEVIPVHTIESSESSDSEQDADIISLEDVGNDLELANISASSVAQVRTHEDIITSNFDVDYLQSKMSDDPEKWKILSEDQYSHIMPKRGVGPRCNRCRQFGHISIRCPNKPLLPNCTLCGQNGHSEPRCPNKVCFTCGKPGNFSTVYCYKCVKQRKGICSLCFIVGHRSDYCPDLWRRYFLTTTEGPLKVPKKNCPTLKPRSKQWCSGCASNGHLEFECDTYKWIREYPASSPQIFKYKDVYGSKAKPQSNKIPPVEKSTTVNIEGAKEPLASNITPEQRSDWQESVADNPETAEKEPQDSVTGTEVGRIAPESLDTTIENRDSEVIDHNIENQSGEQATLEGDSGFLSPNLIQDTVGERGVPPQYEPYLNRRPDDRSSRFERQNKQREHRRKAKINPLSVLRQPTGYTPYQSVLNPYSLLAAQPGNAPGGLLNPVAGQPLINLGSAVTSYQNSEHFYQNNFDFHNQNDMYSNQIPQFGAQIPPNPSPLFLQNPPNSYQDFSNPMIPQPYFDVQTTPSFNENRDFLDRPCTITREPMNYQPIDEVGPRSMDYQRAQGNFRSRDSYERSRYRGNSGSQERNNHPRDSGSDFVPLEKPIQPLMKEYVPQPPSLQLKPKPNNFITLETDGQGNGNLFRTNKARNVDPDTARKFTESSRAHLQEYIERELAKLSALQIHPRVYKKKLNTIYHLKKIDVKTNSIKKQMNFLYKQINMYIFGVLMIGEGKKNLDILRRFVTNYSGPFHDGRRKQLLNAYWFIFGGNEHPDYNYRHHLNTMTVMYRN